MCSIFGALVYGLDDRKTREANRFLEMMYRAAHVRGRDGRGYSVINKFGRTSNRDTQNVDWALLGAPRVTIDGGTQVVIGNTRAEPTTEFVLHKHEHDQQPYGSGDWQIVHNGTIANDVHLRHETANLIPLGLQLSTKVDSAAIVETLEANVQLTDHSWDCFVASIRMLKGSFAILAATEHSDEIYVAANYRPIWYVTTHFGVFFASTRDSFPNDYAPTMLPPYSIMRFDVDSGGILQTISCPLTPPPFNGVYEKPRSLVVCSGGLDSVVSAVYVQKVLGHEVELIHFNYGSRAEAPEMVAIRRVAEELGIPLHIKSLPNVWDIEDSNLLQSDGVIAGGEAGAEFAHEWVPARNLVMLAVATAYAEAKGFVHIVLGNNLEEAGAYPDNEPEFIAKFNDLLPFAVGDGKRVSVIMPVGNMMKHEIVKLGHDIGAPMHLTWSCYRRGVYHCGKCGPCFMRRTAFQINNMEEVISYEV